MARGGGFLSRIGRAIRNVVTPRPAPERPREEPPPPPPKPPPRRARDPYAKIWRKRRGKGDYEKNLQFFHTMIDPITKDEPEARPELWESYVRYLNRGEGKFRRNSNQNMFWRDTGIDPASRGMDWAAWREAMGFTVNGRRVRETP